MRLGECGVVASAALLFGGLAGTGLGVTSGAYFPDRLSRPRTDFRFEVCVSPLPAARGQTPCRRPSTAAAIKRGRFNVPINPINLDSDALSSTDRAPSTLSRLRERRPRAEQGRGFHC